MNILAIECSASPVSAAIINDGKIVSYAYSDIKLTHSQTLFPIIQNVLSSARLSFSDIEAVSVSTGPGSFTGLRIGIACAKGLAEPKRLKCVGVSTLLSAAYMFKGEHAVICPVIDARCSQVYCALFEVDGENITRICEDKAVMIEDLSKVLTGIDDKPIILCGDAAASVLDATNNQSNIKLATPSLMMQNAIGVGLYANKAIKENNYSDSEELMPMYLKLPQAERELKAKQEKEK